MNKRIALLLMITALHLCAASAEVATYRLTVNNTWSEDTHPGLFPEDAHFSSLGGGTHTAAVSFWNEGMLATPGIIEMAEIGGTGKLGGEVNAAIAAGTAGAVLDWQPWFCPAGTSNSNCGPLVVEFEIDSAFPLVTLVTMLGPSPDWFVGVSGLALHDGKQWIDEKVVDLRPYDGGTRDNNAFALLGPKTNPQQPVTRITEESAQIIGSGSLGTFRFERILSTAGRQTVRVPAFNWFYAGLLCMTLIVAATLRKKA